MPPHKDSVRTPIMERLNGRTMRTTTGVFAILLLQSVPLLAFAQTSPFDTGAGSLVTWALTIAVPIAALIVIGLGVAAAAGRISWGLAIGCIAGIACIFGAPQIVTWIRGLFAV